MKNPNVQSYTAAQTTIPASMTAVAGKSPSPPPPEMEESPTGVTGKEIVQTAFERGDIHAVVELQRRGIQPSGLYDVTLEEIGEWAAFHKKARTGQLVTGKEYMAQVFEAGDIHAVARLAKEGRIEPSAYYEPPTPEDIQQFKLWKREARGEVVTGKTIAQTAFEEYGIVPVAAMSKEGIKPATYYEITPQQARQYGLFLMERETGQITKGETLLGFAPTPKVRQVLLQSGVEPEKWYGIPTAEAASDIEALGERQFLTGEEVVAHAAKFWGTGEGKGLMLKDIAPIVAQIERGKIYEVDVEQFEASLAQQAQVQRGLMLGTLVTGEEIQVLARKWGTDEMIWQYQKLDPSAIYETQSFEDLYGWVAKRQSGAILTGKELTKTIGYVAAGVEPTSVHFYEVTPQELAELKDVAHLLFDIPYEKRWEAFYLKTTALKDATYKELAALTPAEFEETFKFHSGAQVALDISDIALYVGLPITAYSLTSKAVSFVASKIPAKVMGWLGAKKLAATAWMHQHVPLYSRVFPPKFAPLEISTHYGIPYSDAERVAQDIAVDWLLTTPKTTLRGVGQITRQLPLAPAPTTTKPTFFAAGQFARLFEPPLHVKGKPATDFPQYRSPKRFDVGAVQRYKYAMPSESKFHFVKPKLPSLKELLADTGGTTTIQRLVTTPQQFTHIFPTLTTAITRMPAASAALVGLGLIAPSLFTPAKMLPTYALDIFEPKMPKEPPLDVGRMFKRSPADWVGIRPSMFMEVEPASTPKPEVSLGVPQMLKTQLRQPQLHRLADTPPPDLKTPTKTVKPPKPPTETRRGRRRRRRKSDIDIYPYRWYLRTFPVTEPAKLLGLKP